MLKKRNCPVKFRDLCPNGACAYIKYKYHIGVSEIKLRRWINHGLISYSGHRIFLRAEKKAGWITCREWIERFLSELDMTTSINDPVEKKDDNLEKLFSLKDAQKYIRRKYQRDITLPTLRNWIVKGLVSRTGRRFILEAKKRGNLFRGWWTTAEHINQFVMELDS